MGDWYVSHTGSVRDYGNITSTQNSQFFFLLGSWKTHFPLRRYPEGRSKLVCVKAENGGLLGTTE